MSTNTTTARNAFLSVVSQPIHAITSNNLGKPAWIAGVEIMALATQLADIEVSLELLENEIKLAKSHAFLDSHNWSDYQKFYNENFRDFCAYLRAKKESAE